jgi:hypothetical protein
MDPKTNPFSPGAGAPPPELAGRASVLSQASIALARIKAGRSERSPLLVGLRGVGKTVLLNAIDADAKKQGYIAVGVEAQEGRNLPSLLVPYLRKALYQLDRAAQISEAVKRGLRILKSFTGTARFTQDGEIELGVGIAPEKGVADSGNLDADLPDLMEAIGEAAKDRQTALALIVDEMQYIKEQELGALISSMHKISQRGLPVLLIGAGLPQLVGNAGRAKSYSERLFLFPEIGPLDPEAAKEALQGPVKEQDVEFTSEALDAICQVTKGYPYFLQEWGYQSWNLAPRSPITATDVQAATLAARKSLDENFFLVRFDRLTPAEKNYLRAMAEGGAAAQRSGAIARRLGQSVEQVAGLRGSLIEKGMLYSPKHGDTEFTVPLFDEFMRRKMPRLGHSKKP